MNINAILSSDKNKALIWNILYEQQIFNNIPNNRIESIKILFENTIKEYTNKNNNTFNDNTEVNITNNNKILLKELCKNIINYKNSIQKQEQEQEHKMTNLLQETKSDYNNQKLNTFNNDLNNHLTNFKTMINNSKPPNEIDFTEKNDEPVDKLDMEELIKQMEKERNNVNNTIFNNSNKIDSSYNIQDKNTDFNTDILNNNVLNDEIIDIIPTIINDENNSNNNNNNNSNSIKITKIDDIESILNIENVNFVTDNNLLNNNLLNNNLSNNNLSNNNLSNNNLSNNNLSNDDLNEKLNLIIKKLDLLEDLILKNFKQ